MHTAIKANRFGVRAEEKQKFGNAQCFELVRVLLNAKRHAPSFQTHASISQGSLRRDLGHQTAPA